MIFWGRASDPYGRRPVLLVSLVGEAVSITLFGFCDHLWQMILLRCVAGMFSGTLVTLRAIVADISNADTAAKAYSWFMLVGSVGIVIGPALGGALARPADNYPGLFGHIRFFHHRPYALVTICTGSFAASVLLVTALFVKETLSKDKSASKSIPNHNRVMSVWQIITAPGMPSVLLVDALVMTIAFAYSAVLPVFWFLAPNLGGYGFNAATMSVGIIVIGLLQTLCSLALFPPLQKRLGTKHVLLVALSVFPIFYALTPVASLALKAHNLALFWILVSSVQVLYSLATMSPVAIQLLLNAASPTPPGLTDKSSTLGTTNSIALVIQSLVRCISPIAFSSLFAISVKEQLLGGYLIWVVLSILSIFCLGASFRLQSPKKGDEANEVES